METAAAPAYGECVCTENVNFRCRVGAAGCLANKCTAS